MATHRYDHGPVSGHLTDVGVPVGVRAAVVCTDQEPPGQQAALQVAPPGEP
jgi:hypothetical protein